MTVFSGAVEGDLDEAVLRRVVEACGGSLGRVYVRGGKPRLVRGIRGYNAAARYSPWVVLIDLDGDAPCAPEYRQELISARSARMCLRIAVRAVESWLLADADAISSFLKVSKAAVPGNPETLEDPKRALVSLAARSKSSSIKGGMVPAPAGGRRVGVQFTSFMLDFVEKHWRPQVAAATADSLRRAITGLRAVVSRET